MPCALNSSTIRLNRSKVITGLTGGSFFTVCSGTGLGTGFHARRTRTSGHFTM